MVKFQSYSSHSIWYKVETKSKLLSTNVIWNSPNYVFRLKVVDFNASTSSEVETHFQCENSEDRINPAEYSKNIE